MSVIGKLSVDLTANISKWKSQLSEANKDAEGFKDKVSRSLSSVGDSASTISPQLGGVVSSLRGIAEVGGPVAISITAVGAALVAATGYASKMAAAFDDLQDQTQLSTEYLGQLEYAARLNGTSIEESANMVTKMQRSLFEASNGNVDMAISISKLGVDIETAMQDGTGGVQTLAKAFAAMPDGIDKVRLMMDILGKSGSKANGIINDLSESTGKTTGRTDEAQRVMKEFDKNLNELYITGGKAVEALAVPVANTINNIIASLRKGVEEAGPLWQQILTGSSYIVKGAVSGAIVGSVVPGVGTVAGAGAGAIAGSGGIVKGYIDQFQGGPRFGQKMTDYEKELEARSAAGEKGGKAYSREPKAAEVKAPEPAEVKAPEPTIPLTPEQRRTIARDSVWKANLAALKKDYDEGKLSLGQYNQKVKEFKEGFDKVNTSAKSSGARRSGSTKEDPGLKNYATAQDDLNKIILKGIITTDGLTESEKKLQELQSSEKWATLTQAQRDNITSRVEAVSALEKQNEATKSFNQTMKDAASAEREAQIETLGLSDAQKKLWEIQQSDVWSKYTIEQRQQIIATYEAKDAADQLRNTELRLKELLTDSGLEKARSDMLLLTSAYEEGKISLEQYQEATANRLNLESPFVAAKESVINLSTAMDSAASKMADAFIAFSATGKMSFADMTKSILADIGKMILQQRIFNSLQSGAKMMASSETSWIAAIGKAFIGSQGAPTTASANGNVFNAGKLVPFANGGAVVSQPTFFPMANGGTGLMGEAGVEGVFPLTRINGKLGIQAAGAGSSYVDQRRYEVAVTVQGSQNNEQTGQIVAEKVMRAIAQQEIVKQQRLGGSLNPMGIR